MAPTYLSAERSVSAISETLTVYHTLRLLIIDEMMGAIEDSRE